MAVGWKLFILNALYNKFPRFKAKYDTVHLFFQSLPTKEDVEQKRLKRERDEASIDNLTLDSNSLVPKIKQVSFRCLAKSTRNFRAVLKRGRERISLFFLVKIQKYL